jgi:hypothetical protein
MRRFTILGFFLSAAIALSGCNGLSIIDNGQSHHVKQFSGGVLVGEWDTVGEVMTTDASAWFKDKRTGRKVEVMGDIQITVNE